MSNTHSRRHAPATSSTEKFEHKVSPGQMAKYNAFMQTADTKSKNFVKETMAEQYMETTADKRGVTVTVTPADKGMRGGPDADMRDGKGHQLRSEAKAESSPLSKGQRNPEKTLVTDPNKALARNGQFKKASGMDQAAADTSQKTLKDGGSVSYEVNRTKATPTGFQTKVTTKTYAAAETGTEGGPVTVTNDASAKTTGFAAPGRATIPLNKAMARSTGTRSSAPSQSSMSTAGKAGAAPRAVGTRSAAASPASGQLTSSKTAAPSGGPSASVMRAGGAPAGKF